MMPASGSRRSGTSIAYAARRLVKKPAFTTVIALTLGLAIGGTAAIYTVVSGVLLKPLPYPEPERLVRVFAQHTRASEMPLPPADFLAFREHTQLFAGVAGFFREGHEFRGIRGAGEPGGPVRHGLVYFELLGARVALGRTFSRDDEHPGVDRVILSERVWRARLGADPAIVGRTCPLLARARSSSSA